MNYIHPLNIKIDLEYIKNLSMEQIVSSVPDGLLSHQRYVKDDQYLSEIQRKYPILGNIYNIYYLKHNSIIPPHIDSDRAVALNFPVKGTSGTSTIFYRTNNLNTEYKSRFVYNSINSTDLTEDFRFCLDRPTLINTGYIHSVENWNQKSRVVMSWSIQSQYTFEEAVEFFTRYPGGVPGNNP
jgi:hypothetical protein